MLYYPCRGLPGHVLSCCVNKVDELGLPSFCTYLMTAAPGGPSWACQGRVALVARGKNYTMAFVSRRRLQPWPRPCYRVASSHFPTRLMMLRNLPLYRATSMLGVTKGAALDIHYNGPIYITSKVSQTYVLNTTNRVYVYIYIYIKVY